MSITLTIRAVESRDLSAVADLWTDLQHAHTDHHPSWTVTSGSTQAYLEHLRQRTTTPHSVLRVVEGVGGVIGFCRGTIVPCPEHRAESRIGSIDEIFLDPSVRDTGIGSALVASVLEEFRRAGITRVETSISADNDGAIRFFERARFCLHTVTLSCDL